ncbi:hypothetical protein [Mesorhizobium sp. LSHC412B00]|uniref:hypothetical protein n=1 Tax=Mesorhizobium sp. LSHC412B00 TaxID=1287285 RepID=UPI0003CEE284|nr:hypothetical protein [Mesorhizobium sp. LSHC412B00]ESX91272.1 hypothetical protein X756_00560 [Mesorhizobium sp. LSHC412B00]
MADGLYRFLSLVSWALQRRNRLAFDFAIRLCRQVEDRSERLRNFSSEARLPRLVYVALNREVASDAGTQELRRGMNVRLLGIAAILVILKLVDLVGWPSA